ncbi:restriction endonuclease subunit S [Corynebacterium diphtheriae]|uniref:restriction endonuclease subunit S n=1 Tax=Corynebacterium diphtheriae TaxID=1717 RepID=UPI0013C8D74A|nr:hypothetical protein CIP107532_02415 [Corynebacterium diphtheriae]CAB0622098.1 hypothetical protein CIP107550_02326 [Corynebacterium diphtheriae]CAB0623863.1 hypothetical protein CIP107546_02277 [Corynebacterium diphtheriae]CAB0671143.1 hypothetical protein CIP107562_02367 [Corynebacterium diphtheriae]
MVIFKKLGDVLTVLDSARRPIKSNERIPGKTPYLGASGVVDFVEGRTHEGPLLCLAEDGENLQSRLLPVAWCQDGEFWANNHVHVLGGVSRNRLKFFEYAILNTDLSGYITGSAQPKLSQQAMRNITVPDFGFDEEERIGEFFGALDDKIAANIRVKGTCTELIKTIGSIPNNNIPVSELAVQVKKQISAGKIQELDVRHYSIPAFDLGYASIESGAEIKSGKNLIEAPCVLVSKLNPRTPRIWSIPTVDSEETTVCSTEFTAWQGTTVPQAALYAALLQGSFSEQLQERASGTSNSHQRVRPQDIQEATIPDVRKLDQETLKLLEALNLQAADLIKENQALARTRDELLPLLMNGKITVAEAKEAAGDVGVVKQNQQEEGDSSV